MHNYVRSGLSFDVTDEGPTDGRVVIALHGFPEDRSCWSTVIPQLTAQGYRVLAPDQRGYSPAARPRGRRAYVLSELAADVMALADVAGADRFDVVGHDWGAAVAWELAGRHPDRVRTMTALSVPHPAAMRAAALRGGQLARSWYMLFFQLPRIPEMAFRFSGSRRIARTLEADGLDADSAARYAARLLRPADSTAALNWYRAIPLASRHPLPPVHVPVLYVYGDRDTYLTRAAAEGTARHVTGSYRFEVLQGMSHWLPTGAALRVAELVGQHLADHRA
ncbi:MAG: alpha/beta fold hydrolase [Actinomycetota bacterium]|nr:alpha/beta fold hydrolase [Actinomycetota bacterium]